MTKLFGEQKEQALKWYKSGVCGAEISRRINGLLTGDSVMAMIKRNGLKSRGNYKFKINKEFFKKIDTGDKAYFLGILYADGYIDEKRGQAEITLQESDREILEKLSKLINGDKKLTFKKAKKHHRTGNMESNHIRLYIKSREMTNDLINLGLRQAKSFNVEFPNKNQIPKHLLWHFIRGYFDGDGWICIKNKINKNDKQGTCGMISSISFIDSLKSFLEEYNLKSYINYITRKYSKPMADLNIYKINDILFFYHKLYENTSIFMKRKKEKFEELFKEKGVSLPCTL